MVVKMKHSNIEANSSVAGGFRFKAGLTIFVLAYALWLIIPLATYGGASAASIAKLTGIVFAANKILVVACIAVMGKPGFQRLKGIVFRYIKGLTPGDTVGPTRHAIGLVMFCGPLVSAMLGPYVDAMLPGLRPNRWELQALGDLMLAASFVVLGGDFWNKFRALFIRSAKVVDV